MSTTELKEQLLEKLKETSNQTVLEGVSRLLHIEEEMEAIHVLTTEQKAILMQSKHEIEKGHYISNEQLNTDKL
jgi:hypothetical protein